ncbi:MAG TPA: response regulator [Caulobacteraceae bacterium]
MHLPLRRAEPAHDAALASAPLTAAPAGERVLRILAAEDNDVNQLVLKTLLAQAGLDLTLVADGALAVAAWAEDEWDLVLMDVQMPVMDGLAAVQEIRARERSSGRARTPVIALTGNAMAHQVAELIAAGMDDHVAKPIQVTRLFSAIEAALSD